MNKLGLIGVVLVLVACSDDGTGSKPAADTGVQDMTSDMAEDSGNADASMDAAVSDMEADATDAAMMPDGGGDMAQASCVAGDNMCPEACTWVVDADCQVCNGTTGLVKPMSTCSAEYPCTELLESYTIALITNPPLEEIDFPTFVPSCTTSTRALNQGRPMYDDGAPKEWVDQDGLTRYHCEYRPPGTSTTSKRPLLIVVHGSGGYAYSVYDTQSWRGKAPTYDLSGDVNRPGFILVAPQARNLHWPSATAQDGSKHDTFFRDLGSPSQNRDIAYYDRLIDTLVDEGVVDPDRIYMTGWSNGARFAAMYAIARQNSPTPGIPEENIAGGNQIAAVVNYSGGDPFMNTTTTEMPTCQLATYPTSDVPIMMFSRNCDVVACSVAQDDDFRTNENVDTAPGNIASAWINTLGTTIQNPNVEWHLLSRRGELVDPKVCEGPGLCSVARGLVNHTTWPDGVRDLANIDHEPTMLDFLRANPL